MKEIWRDIKDYEGLYQVSNFGRLKSLWFGRERILRPGKERGGYEMIILCKNGKREHFKIHRLVGMMFLDMVDWTEDAKGRPFSELTINHLNEVKTDNRVENLQWCPLEHNLKYGTHYERVAKTKSKTVYQYTVDGEFVREWFSATEAQRQTGWNHSNIAKCCLGKKRYYTAYGFKWSYSRL